MGAMSSARADQHGSPGCSCPANRQRHRADSVHGTTSVENVNPTVEATSPGPSATPTGLAQGKRKSNDPKTAFDHGREATPSLSWPYAVHPTPTPNERFPMPKTNSVTLRTANRVFQEIEADLESSRRHWSNVLQMAEVRLADTSMPESWKKRAMRDVEVAKGKLAQLARGERVSLAC